MDVIDKIGSGFRGYLSRSDATWGVLGVILVMVVGALVMHYLLAGRERMGREARHLFRRISAGHRLTYGETRTILKISLQLQLPDPCLIFVRRSLFESAAGEIGLDDAVVRSLRDKVFGP